MEKVCRLSSQEDLRKQFSTYLILVLAVVCYLLYNVRVILPLI